ncbi:branched-chain amino acid ABC transporter permease [Pseudolysinimonas yzui]|uniref:Branched-chain amino acid ABC transporter permease n=1 Tax=Pseudolysinimonas yzui TaxID=2708254 RepID=A0A8J3GQT5_9MICO|nr:branched-chain amino acid ABC transporter permease [Pseudolysinimonas yzui]GHF17937.1 branched-chain amino acid ABC transporter permease [Pseudolysinimonas yzui]
MRRLAPYIPIAAFAIVAIILPLFVRDLTFLMQMLLSMIVVVGLTLFMGYAGQASLGQSAFVAVGALTVGVLCRQLGLPPVVGLLAAPVVAGAFAVAIGAPLLRLRGHYLAFGTLAVLLLVHLVMSTVPLFGGGVGIMGIPPLLPGGQLGYVYLAVGILVIALVVSQHLVASRFGRGMRALRGSETAAASSGVPVLRSKIQVFGLSAVFAGFAGALSAFFIPFVSQDSFPASKSFEYVIMAVVGGIGSLWGGIVGVLVIAVLLQVLNVLSTMPGLPATAGPTLQYAGYAIVLVVVLLFLPDGIVPSIQKAWRRRVASRKEKASWRTSVSAHR